MPQSRHRHKHGHHAAKVPPHAVKAAPRRSAVTIMVIFLAVLGMFIAFIASGGGWPWIAAGGVVGAVAGYFIGHSMDKTAKN